MILMDYRSMYESLVVRNKELLIARKKLELDVKSMGELIVSLRKK